MTMQSLNINLIQQNRVLQAVYYSKSIKYLWYQGLYMKSIANVIQSNEYFGKVFLVFMAFNFPINCYLIIQLFSSFSITMKIIIFLLCWMQTTVIFALHFIMAKLNSRLRIKKFVSSYLSNRIFFNIRANLRISLFIQAFYTKKRYGFTYGALGIVSLFSFTKVSLTFVFQ